MSNDIVVPGRKNRIELIQYDKNKFRLQGKIKNSFGMLKESKRLAFYFKKSNLCFECLLILLGVLRHFYFTNLSVKTTGAPSAIDL